MPRYAAEKALGEEGCCFGFETGAASVLVLWLADEEAAPRAVMPSPELRALDLMGRSMPPGPLPLSTAPIYLLGPPGKASQLAASLRWLPR